MQARAGVAIVVHDSAIDVFSSGRARLFTGEAVGIEFVFRSFRMAPHVRAHHHHGCSPPLMASERYGLYLVANTGERTHFCDVVGYGAFMDAHWHNWLYTGPGEKAITGIRHRRTEGEIAVYEKHHEVGLENDVAAGGFAEFLHSRKRKSYDVWLFGPLSFLDHSYGSLIIELAGYQDRKIFSKRASWEKMIYWTEFPKGMAGHFHSCKLLQTGYHLDVKRTQPDIEDLRLKREEARPVHLPKPYVGVEWKVVSQVAAQTDCALYEQEGL